MYLLLEVRTFCSCLFGKKIEAFLARFRPLGSHLFLEQKLVFEAWCQGVLLPSFVDTSGDILQDADSFHSCFSADKSGFVSLAVGIFRSHPWETQVCIFSGTSWRFATVACVFWKTLTSTWTDFAADFLAPNKFPCSQCSADQSGYFRQDVKTLCSHLFAPQKKAVVCSETSRYFAVSFLPTKAGILTQENWNITAQNSWKLLRKGDLAYTRRFSSKCCKQVELLHIISRLPYIFDGKKNHDLLGGEKWDLRWISCLAFVSDNLSCSHMIGIKALNTVKPFIFNGLAAMSHLLQRAGQAELTSPTLVFKLFSHSDQVRRWPFRWDY